MKHSKKTELPTRDGVVERQVLSRKSDHCQSILSDQIAEEIAIAFSYNGQSHAVMMASPIDLDDFAIGFSITEQIVDSVDDILQIDVQPAKQGICINLQIKPQLIERLANRKRQLSGRSGCGICGVADLAAAMPELQALTPRPLVSHRIIEQAVQTFHQHQNLQNQSGAVHAAALFDTSANLLALREDVGRHSALDKVIGATINQAKADHFVLMSSRASHELIVKTVIAGIGTLVCISAATSLAIKMAEQTNLNLVGFVRGSRQLIYNKG